MTVNEIKKLLQTPAYEFLRTNERLGDNIIFLTLGGSHAYGTNVETSDVDIRGCTLNTPSDLIGFSHFEQFIDKATDTTIYGFNKLIPLLLNCNPNTIELLGCKPGHYIVLTDIGRKMIENRKLFLSQAAANSFGGYATQQLRRLECALARDKLPQHQKENHILGAVKRAMDTFGERFSPFEDGAVSFYISESAKEDMEVELFADINLSHYPARSLKGMQNEISNVIGTYEKLNYRNHKKDDLHLNKHAMHLIRLYLTCLDIFEKEEIITYRDGDDHELLMSIRRGDYQKEDGTFRQEFFDMVAEYEQRMAYAKAHTSLPVKPDKRHIEEFVMEVNRNIVCGDTIAS